MQMSSPLSSWLVPQRQPLSEELDLPVNKSAQIFFSPAFDAVEFGGLLDLVDMVDIVLLFACDVARAPGQRLHVQPCVVK
jgi:hypothetical protein